MTNLISLTMRPPEDEGVLSIVQRYLGHDPYVVIVAALADPMDLASEDVTLTVETGGGIPQNKDDLATWLEDLAASLRTLPEPLEYEEDEAARG